MVAQRLDHEVAEDSEAQVPPAEYINLPNDSGEHWVAMEARSGETSAFSIRLKKGFPDEWSETSQLLPIPPEPIW